MTLHQMAYIVAVEDFKSFQAAAKYKNVTQPTLSMQIQKLEEELGIILFDRSKYPVKPTSLGKSIIAQARIVLEEAAKIDALIRKESSEVGGKFRLGIIPTIAPYLIPLFLKNVVEKYPELEITLDENQTGVLIDKLRRDELDAAIVATPTEEADMTEIPLYYEPFVGYVSEDHRLFRNSRIDPSDLRLDDLFLLREGHCFREHVINICGSLSGEETKIFNSLNFEGSTLDTLMKLVENNFGMTLLPYLLATELRHTNKQKYIREFSEPVPTREISIIHRKIFIKNGIIAELKNEIRKLLPDELQKAEPGNVIRWKQT